MDTLRRLCMSVLVLVITGHVTSSSYGGERDGLVIGNFRTGHNIGVDNFRTGNNVGARRPSPNRLPSNTENRSGSYPSGISPLLYDALCSLCLRLPRQRYQPCVRRYCTI